MKSVGKALERLGNLLMLFGGLLIAAIFLTVLINGHWPDFLGPVRNSARAISGYIGGLVWLVWVAVFIGPGFVVHSVGEHLASRR